MRLVSVFGAVVLSLAVSSLSPTAAAADAAGDVPAVTDYTLSWHLIKGDHFTLDLDKTVDTTTFYLSARMESSRILPKDAEVLAGVLGKSEEKYNALKGDTDKSETVKAGKYVVTFRFSSQYGFAVGIREADGIPMSSVSLSRDQCKDVAKYFAMGTKLAAALDAKVKG